MNAPRPEPDCPHRELAVGWALHCLEPAEESLFAAHLPGCAECRQSVREAEEVGAALAVTVPDAVPPESLQHRILATADVADVADDDQGGGHTERAADPPAEGSRRGGVTALPQPSGSRPAGRMGRVLAAAAVVALVAVAGVLGVRVAQLDAERDRVAQQVAQLDAERDRVAQQMASMSQQVASMSQLVERMAGPDSSAVTLAGTDGRPMAMLVAEPGRVTVMPMDLPANSASEAYVLWGIGAGGPVALDSFDVATDSTVVHTVGSLPKAVAYSAFAVSVEPGRTPPAAPSNVLATGEVDS